METYLEYLGLLRDGELTQDGGRALETECVMVTEAGIYELLYVIDKTFGNRIISYRRREPKDILEGNTQSFSDFEYFDERTFPEIFGKDISKDFFWIKFQRQKNETPKIIMAGSLEASLVIEYDSQSDGCLNFSAILSRRKNEYTESLPSFNINNNLSNLIKGWNPEIKALEMDYDEAKEKPAILHNFVTTMSLTGKPLYMTESLDDGDWDIEITLPVVPKSKRDALEWVSYLVIDDLMKKERYLSIAKLEELEQEKMEESLIEKKFKDFFVSGQKLLEIIKRDEDTQSLFWRIMAVEDLSIPHEFMEDGP